MWTNSYHSLFGGVTLESRSDCNGDCNRQQYPFVLVAVQATCDIAWRPLYQQLCLKNYVVTIFPIDTKTHYMHLDAKRHVQINACTVKYTRPEKDRHWIMKQKEQIRKSTSNVANVSGRCISHLLFMFKCQLHHSNYRRTEQGFMSSIEGVHRPVVAPGSFGSPWIPWIHD